MVFRERKRMNNYSALKKNLPFVSTWKDLEGIVLSKISQKKKTNTVLFHSWWNLKQTNKSQK